MILSILIINIARVKQIVLVRKKLSFSQLILKIFACATSTSLSQGFKSVVIVLYFVHSSSFGTGTTRSYVSLSMVYPGQPTTPRQPRSQAKLLLRLHNRLNVFLKNATSKTVGSVPIVNLRSPCRGLILKRQSWLALTHGRKQTML